MSHLIKSVASTTFGLFSAVIGTVLFVVHVLLRVKAWNKQYDNN